MPSTVTDVLEEGLTALPAGFVWELAGKRLRVPQDGYDEGFEDVGEIEDDDQDAGGDGSVAGEQRIAARAVSVVHSVNPGDGPLDDSADDAHEAFVAEIHELRKVMAPLPNRTATRLFRFRRRGAEAQRLYVRPSRGRPLTVPGDDKRILWGLTTEIVLRLTAPDGIIWSDALHQVTFTAGETIDIDNKGSLCVRRPGTWCLTAEDGPVTISHEDYPGESVTFPANGALTVTRRYGVADALSIVAPGTYGKCHGPAGVLFVRWPLLRPGINHIRASAPCTFSWRDSS